MPRVLKTIFAGAAILAVTTLPCLSADNRFAGYLLDRSCATNMKTNGFVPDDTHKKECALNDTCSHDGYAIYSKGQWYQLDKKGNEMARHLLQTTKTTEGHYIIVSGTLDKDQLKVSTLREVPKQ